ncbi:MAG TPA: tRNA dihydrouridine(20/20a) synthase DusA [Gammaproteobacteria bacterium]|nr:tRNA dihydrouridine(20/20a) synthase DusA [Gammaproteobacteria bacterium]
MTTNTEPVRLPPRRLAVAPMMNRTDRHFRYLMRLITRRTWLYTEMVVARGVVRGDAQKLLAYNGEEHPVALQLGGHEPAVLADAARLAYAHGYDEVNLNIGCPSPRVSAGRMGACLMEEPGLVADCVAAMREASPLPVTVKTRLGIDHEDSLEFLCRFVECVAAAGCRTFIIHARKAWLNGVSPKANRNVPPLDYPRVAHVKRMYPELEIIVNGGIADLDGAAGLLAGVDGVMLGRGAYASPLMFATADARFYGETTGHEPRRAQVLTGYLHYLRSCVARGEKLGPALRHVPAILGGVPGARRVRARLGALAGTQDVAGVERALMPILEAG